MTPTFKREEDVTADLLTLVGVDVPVETVIGWTDEQVQQAEDWAAAAHMKASDNNLLVPPMPLFLRPFDVARIQP